MNNTKIDYQTSFSIGSLDLLVSPQNQKKLKIARFLRCQLSE